MQSLFQDDNVARAANCVLNIEKLLIQKKIALDQVGEDDFTKLISYMERIVKLYTATVRRKVSPEEEQNQQLLVRLVLSYFQAQALERQAAVRVAATQCCREPSLSAVPSSLSPCPAALVPTFRLHSPSCRFASVTRSFAGEHGVAH